MMMHRNNISDKFPGQVLSCRCCQILGAANDGVVENKLVWGSFGGINFISLMTIQNFAISFIEKALREI